MKKIIFGIFGLIIVSSCSTRKEIVYFQGIERLEGMETLMEFEPVFEINDILQIQVSSIDPLAVAPFQMNMNNSSQIRSGNQGSGGISSGGGGSSNSASIGYLIDIEGNIQFPVLGEIEVAGMSRSNFQDYLTAELRKYVKDAVVAVRLINFRVVVLGETGQTVVQVENERMSVPELLANVGGITYEGKRDNILVIREEDGVIKHGYVDMTSAEDVFRNPYYYLKQNDIVYVEPTYRQVKSAGWITGYQGIFSLITSAISLYFIFNNF